MMVLPPLEVKTRVFIPEKAIAYPDLGCDHPILSKGCWGLDTCGYLIGGPYGLIVWSTFSGMWSRL